MLHVYSFELHREVSCIVQPSHLLVGLGPCRALWAPATAGLVLECAFYEFKKKTLKIAFFKLILKLGTKFKFVLLFFYFCIFKTYSDCCYNYVTLQIKTKLERYWPGGLVHMACQHGRRYMLRRAAWARPVTRASFPKKWATLTPPSSQTVRPT